MQRGTAVEVTNKLQTCTTCSATPSHPPSPLTAVGRAAVEVYVQRADTMLEHSMTVLNTSSLVCAVPSYKRATAVEEYGARADTMLEADADDGGWVAPAHDPESSAARAEDVSSAPAAGGAVALQPGRHGSQPAEASHDSSCRPLCCRIQPDRHRE